jgi:C4-dicarboxylate transporter DctQ subunit
MIKKIDKAITWFENTFLISGMLAVSAILFFNVVLRYVFSAGLSWAEELSRYIIIWMVTIGIGAAARENIHMRITALIDLTKNKKLHFWVNLFALVSGFIFSIFLIIFGIRLVISMIMNNQLSPAMELPLWIVYAAIPLGGLLMTYRLTQSLILKVNEFKKLGGKK